MKKTILFIALGLALGAGFTACKGKPKLLTEAEMQARVDSLVTAQKATLGPELDQLCEAKLPSLIQTAVDSIVAASQPAAPSK
jgi:hypothetical protein